MLFDIDFDNEIVKTYIKIFLDRYKNEALVAKNESLDQYCNRYKINRHNYRDFMSLLPCIKQFKELHSKELFLYNVSDINIDMIPSKFIRSAIDGAIEQLESHKHGIKVKIFNTLKFVDAISNISSVTCKLQLSISLRDMFGDDVFYVSSLCRRIMMCINNSWSLDNIFNKNWSIPGKNNKDITEEEKEVKLLIPAGL